MSEASGKLRRSSVAVAAKTPNPSPESWKQQNIQLPEETWRVFKAESAQRGHSSVRVLGTMAVNVILGMPPRARDRLFAWANVIAFAKGPDALTIEDTWLMFRNFLEVAEGGKAISEQQAREAAQWFIDRILDPEVTPPPGEKSSDRQEGDEGEAGERARRKGA